MTLPAGLYASDEDHTTVPCDAPGTVALEIDRELFSVDTVLRAAYKFTDRCFIYLRTHDARPGRWHAVLKKKPAVVLPIEDIAGELANELIDQRLRERLEHQFGDVRTLIVAQAFAEGNLLEPTRAEQDYVADPQGIGRLRP
jgi:His-Xaa-Ser system protein HxsD